MIQSLAEFCEDFEIYVLCLDCKTKNILEKINNSHIKCIELFEVENNDLLKAKKDRTKTEYCWTLASNFTWYVMDNFKDINLITYLDADLLFYSSFEPIFKEIKNSSIAIIEHRFAQPYKNLEVNGKFCVEWNSFRRDEEGLRCLNRWRKQCLEWCFYKLEDGKMGDQKYLDEWPDLYTSCHIIENVGAGIAPWNYSQYEIKNKKDKITINGENLIFYHFHQFEILNNREFFRLGKIYTSNQNEPELIYQIYEEKLLKSLSEIYKIDKNFAEGIKNKNALYKEKIAYLIPRKIKDFLRRSL
tara:strand:+ start:272 stop:1174 length:903 start_codon:yes stop_codon:yes gene_type:complete